MAWHGSPQGSARKIPGSMILGLGLKIVTKDILPMTCWKISCVTVCCRGSTSKQKHPNNFQASLKGDVPAGGLSPSTKVMHLSGKSGSCSCWA